MKINCIGKILIAFYFWSQQTTFFDVTGLFLESYCKNVHFRRHSTYFQTKVFYYIAVLIALHTQVILLICLFTSSALQNILKTHLYRFFIQCLTKVRTYLLFKFIVHYWITITVFVIVGKFFRNVTNGSVLAFYSVSKLFQNKSFKIYSKRLWNVSFSWYQVKKRPSWICHIFLTCSFSISFLLLKISNVLLIILYNFVLMEFTF